jgi:hypothetical protein
VVGGLRLRAVFDIVSARRDSDGWFN